MSRFEMRLERLELKYLVDEAQAERIRRDVEAYCAPDAHNRTSGPRRGYTVSSLYLDSPGLAFHQAKERGEPNRLKLRLRRYSGATISAVESKRRVCDVVDKRRVLVDRQVAEDVTFGRVPNDLPPQERDMLEAFSTSVACFGAEPTLHVRYEREAYSSDVDDYARVTFDRHITAQRVHDGSFRPTDEGWHAFEDSWQREESDRAVVLELKCQASSVPWWITETVRAHGLKRTSFSKYSVGIHVTDRLEGKFDRARRAARVML